MERILTPFPVFSKRGLSSVKEEPSSVASYLCEAMFNQIQLYNSGT